MADGFVKEPAVVTRKNFNPAGMSPEEIERLKLEDGVRLHERRRCCWKRTPAKTGRANRETVCAGHRSGHDPRQPIDAA